MKLNSLNYKVTAGVLFVGLLGVSIIISSVQGQKAPAPELAQYSVVFLVKGPRWTAEETPETNRLQAEHLAHIGRGCMIAGSSYWPDPFPMMEIFGVWESLRQVRSKRRNNSRKTTNQ